MIELILHVCTFVGAGVIIAGLGIALIDVLRAAYWSLWCLVPIMRGQPEIATVRAAITFVGWMFWDEVWCFGYTTRSCKFYSHGWWPWEPRQYYT